MSGETDRCPVCFGLNGAHSLIHTRHREGDGGSNLPCPRAEASRPALPSRDALVASIRGALWPEGIDQEEFPVADRIADRIIADAKEQK